MHEGILLDNEGYATESEVRSFARAVSMLFDEKGSLFRVDNFPWNGCYRARVPQQYLAGLEEYESWEYCDIEVDPVRTDESEPRDLMFIFVQSGPSAPQNGLKDIDTIEKTILLRRNGETYIDIAGYNQEAMLRSMMAGGEYRSLFRPSQPVREELEDLEYVHAASQDALTRSELTYLLRLVDTALN